MLLKLSAEIDWKFSKMLQNWMGDKGQKYVRAFPEFLCKIPLNSSWMLIVLSLIIMNWE